MRLLLDVITWAVWFGSLAAVIFIDRNIRQARQQASGTVDFTDDRIGSYLALGVICGGAVLPMYFWVTRRSFVGVLIGLLLTAACFFATIVVAVVGALVLVHH